MDKKLLIAGAIALMSVPSLAQQVKVYDTGTKWDARLNHLVEGRTMQVLSANKSTQTVTPQSNISVSVSVNDAAAVEAAIKAAGYEAEIITDELVVAHIPASYITTLAEQPNVLFINAPRQFHKLMHNVRPETGVTKVTAGEGLETPFTGKGVVIGVIDQGFEYKHPAFKGRVVRYGANSGGGILTERMPTSDRLDDVGHATHVANIAAGSKVEGSDYYGIATGADLILVSSKFTDTAVEAQAKSIKDYAEKNGQPWVINMSFGSIIGPHDGSTSHDQNMSKLCGEGGIMVAAMGNEGNDKFHAYREITSDSEPVYLYMKTDNNYNPNKIILSELWGTATDAQAHLTIKPCIINGSRLYEPTDEQLDNLSGFSTGIDPYNNRQYARLHLNSQVLASILKVTGTSYKVVWQVSGKQGDSFHAWIDGSNYYGNNFMAMSVGKYKAHSGDAEYMVGEGAATIGKAIAVASYNAASRFTNLNGSTYDAGVGETGDISNFSSHGPLVGEATPKPAVAGPGGTVLSAFSKNSAQFENYRSYQVQKVNSEGGTYYYGMMSGTSMATPAVTGIIALWLEANPKLTYENILDIMKATGRRDNHVGKVDANNWNATWGFGKIDAYNGLKKALEMKGQSGIDETLNSEAPVTISKNHNEWRVLFNNNESFATLQVFNTNGQLVSSEYVDAPRCGTERVVNLANFAPGVYLFKVSTTASSTTRKLVVK